MARPSSMQGAADASSASTTELGERRSPHLTPPPAACCCGAGCGQNQGWSLCCQGKPSPKHHRKERASTAYSVRPAARVPAPEACSVPASTHKQPLEGDRERDSARELSAVTGQVRRWPSIPCMSLPPPCECR